MARVIPKPGETFTGDDPAVVKVAKCVLFATASRDSDVDTLAGDVEVPVFGDSSAAQVLAIFSVPAGCFVHELLAETKISWGGSSDVVEVTVGDTASASGYFTDTAWSSTSHAAGLPQSSKLVSAGTYAAGKRYAAATDIEVTITPITSAAAATGYTVFHLVYSMAGAL